MSLSPADVEASLSCTFGFVSCVRDEGLSPECGLDMRVRDSGRSSFGAEGSDRVCETVKISFKLGPDFACNSSSDIS